MTTPFDTKGFVAKIIADSINPDKNRVTTFLLTYPRFIHAELMTHRVFSRNAASSRAIPIEKVIEQVKTNPAKPVRWGKNGKGMQDHGWYEENSEDYNAAEMMWKYAADSAVRAAAGLQAVDLHKQIVNRILEPFVWMTTLVTATEWENFFSLRVHKDAQPEFQHLAYMMLRTYVDGYPETKDWGEWHIPYGDRMPDGLEDTTKLKIATARAARVSYLTMDGRIDTDKDVALHDSLASNGHWSPFEHVCQAKKSANKGNFYGWEQYRHSFSMENRKCDLKKLLEEYERSIAPGTKNVSSR